MSLEFDLTPFLRSMRHLQKKVAPEAFRKAVTEVALTVMNDAVEDIPKPPIDTGHLRGSGSAFVDDHLVGTTLNTTGVGSPANAHTEPKEAHHIIAVVGFNTPYAARWHEVEPPNWHLKRTTPFRDAESGTKYLEKKLSTNAQKYGNILAATIKANL